MDLLGHQPQVLLIPRVLLGSLFAAILLGGCGGGASNAVRFTCPQNPLLGVYSPARLKVLKPCQHFRGTVIEVAHRKDGDTHLLVRPEPASARLLNVRNVNDGGLVAEIMPGQRLPPPKVNERVELFGTWVYDTHNDWNEIHPVWGERDLDTGTRSFSLPPRSPVYQGKSKD